MTSFLRFYFFFFCLLEETATTVCVGVTAVLEVTTSTVLGDNSSVVVLGVIRVDCWFCKISDGHDDCDVIT